MSIETVSRNVEKATELSGREIGAKVLAQSGFRARHEIVDSSFDKARERGERLVGKNEERRVDAYLERITRGVEKFGSEYEKRLWDKTVDSLIVEPEDIDEKYWQTQEQILRDNGQGRELSQQEKDLLVEDIQKQQRSSIESWTTYLSHEDCPYPTWFKCYVIDGVSKMGVFDKRQKTFRKRGKGSVASYPHFNAATLGKVYSAIADFYGLEGKDLRADAESDTVRDSELDALVKSGNFNKLYSRMLLSEKVIMKTPERTEDIDGEWAEYAPGDEERLAAAADGTPWCIASPNVGRSYLTTGRYGESYDDGEYDEDNKAKFILFHLKDEDGRLAENACASIRLDTEGNVAEISGLNDGQALEDSLVPIVEEKVRSLPGGEKFLKRFADKNRLIALDRKIQAGEDITKEEFRFIWELDRPIEILDTYNSDDPRIEEFREKFDKEYAKLRGYIIPETTTDDIHSNFETYLLEDIELSSNLLTYILKTELGRMNPDARGDFSESDIIKFLASRSVTSTGGAIGDRMTVVGRAIVDRINELGGMSHISQMAERINNLETLETENYIFMLPKDQWGKERIELPENTEGKYIAPADLTAILKAPVEYDWSYETDGRESGTRDVYGVNWIGREIRHFPWSKELFAAERGLLIPNGYHIPKSWGPIVDGVAEQIGLHLRDGYYVNSDGEDKEDQLSLALRDKLGLAFSGYVWKGEPLTVGKYGYFWSTPEDSADSAYCLGFSDDGVNPEYNGSCSGAHSVRCVSGSEDGEA
ncbi:hypothetical protein IKH83_02090 [Candidatus Saccharibacteria bacterium]|nr:hypothetical protein [Candidatus Saccharibacteria bacterium]